MRYQQDLCPIWATPSDQHNAGDNGVTIVPNSFRACGSYQVTEDALSSILYLDKEVRTLLTTWLVDQHAHGVHIPLITSSVVEAAKTARPLAVTDRALRLLRLLEQASSVIGEPVPLLMLDDPTHAGDDDQHVESIRNQYKALAWSESIRMLELIFLLDYLSANGWITKHDYNVTDYITLTIDGYSYLSSARPESDQSQAFVAMWFDEEMNEGFERGFRPAIEDAGYNPIRIDRKEHINKVDDEIIAEIRRSRFLVADFSQGEDGARGGVYYEAGFAHGLDIPVIYTCREEDLDKLHFDTRQYNHIVWETPEDLREALKHRIRAVIGEGPNTPPATT